MISKIELSNSAKNLDLTKYIQYMPSAVRGLIITGLQPFIKADT